MKIFIKRSLLRNFTFSIVNSVIVFLLLFVVAEITLRLTLLKKAYYLLPPGRSFVIKTRDAARFNIDDNPVININSSGLRGPELPRVRAKNDYIILFVGGSTTECGLLNEDNTWPALAAKNYNNSSLRKYNIIPGNAGRAAHTTRNHIVLLEYLLPQNKPQGVVILCGGNDVGVILGEDYDPNYYLDANALEDIKIKTFWSFEAEHNLTVPFYKRLMVWRFARKLKVEYTNLSVLKESFLDAGSYIHLRGERRVKAYKTNNVLSDKNFVKRLEDGLREYRRNIIQIINVCRRNNVKVIFMTQPTIYRVGLSDEIKELLWLGKANFFSKKGELVYISEKDGVAVLSLYNNVLKDVCLKNNIECIDLAGIINKDTDNFYDDGHFNKKGAHKVGEALGLYLSNNL